MKAWVIACRAPLRSLAFLRREYHPRHRVRLFSILHKCKETGGQRHKYSGKYWEENHG